MVGVGDGNILFHPFRFFFFFSSAFSTFSTSPLSLMRLTSHAGPWDTMEEFDDGLSERKFDNFQFVNFYKVISQAENREVDFAIAALMEIPEQFLLIRKLRLL
jgi:E3 ubiquitin-protein ligase RGLG